MIKCNKRGTTMATDREGHAGGSVGKFMMEGLCYCMLP